MSQETEQALVFFARPKREFLLGYKKHGKRARHWDGIGGEVGATESDAEVMIRECQESIEVTPTDFRQIAQIVFTGWYKRSPYEDLIKAYLCESWEGEIVETKHTKPGWHKFLEVPYHKMRPGYDIWLPLALSGGFFEGSVDVGPQKNVTNWRINEVVKHE